MRRKGMRERRSEKFGRVMTEKEKGFAERLGHARRRGLDGDGRSERPSIV